MLLDTELVMAFNKCMNLFTLIYTELISLATFVLEIVKWNVYLFTEDDKLVVDIIFGEDDAYWL